MVTTQKEIEITLSDSGSITKDKFIQLWKQAEDSPLQPRPISEGHSGSTIDEDGIRICGTLDFIFSVVSRLKDLFALEREDLFDTADDRKARDEARPLGGPDLPDLDERLVTPNK